MAITTSKLTTLAQLRAQAARIKTELDKKANSADLGSLASLSEVGYDNLAAALKLLIDGKASGDDLSTVSGKISTLIGNTEGDDAKSVRAISAEEVAKIVANADTKYDTLKEIADWILSDTTGAAKMATDITNLQTKTTLGKDGDGKEYTTVKAYVEAVIANFISLSALSAPVTGDGNALTGVTYDNTTGAFNFVKGATFLTAADVPVATDSEVNTMLTEVFGAAAE